LPGVQFWRGRAILVGMESDLKASDIASEIRALARLHSVSYQRSRLDDLADQITRLAGDDVELDDVQKLLIALRRADILSAREMTRYHVAYLRQAYP